MNMSASQCSSSGCESGWTLYLDQSSLSKNQYQSFGGFVDGNNYARAENNDDDDDEEEGLSMVSDASSGPPHYCEDDEEYCFDQLASSKKNRNKQKSRECSTSQQQQYSYLDDTASSPVLNKKAAGKNNEASMEFSQGFSATHFKGKYSLKKQFGLFQSEKPASKESGGFQGRKWK